MTERFTAKDFTKQADTLWTTSDRVNLEGLLRQAAATEDGLVKLCAEIQKDIDDVPEGHLPSLALVGVREIMKSEGLWRDPEGET